MANTTITVNVAESQNYLATSRTISVQSNAKDAGYITLSTNSVTISGTTGTTSTVTITSNSGGTLSVASSDTSKVTASLSGTTITLTGIASGSATITVTVGETSTHTAATATISVTASIVSYVVPDISSCTDAELIECVNKYYAGEISLADIQAGWTTGSIRKFADTGVSGTYYEKSSGQYNQTYMLCGINVDTLTTPINGKTKALLTFIGVYTAAKATTYTNGYVHYVDSGLRNELNTDCKNSYTNIGQYIKQVTKNTQINYDASSPSPRTVTHSDYVWLPSYPELQLSTSVGGEVVYPNKPNITHNIYTRSSNDNGVYLTGITYNIRAWNSGSGGLLYDNWGMPKKDTTIGFCL